MAIALCLLALMSLIDGRWPRAGWLFGFAVVMQPLVLSLLPLAVGFTVPSRRMAFSIRALALPVVLVGCVFAAAPGNSYRAVVEQPTQPWTDHATPWIGTSPVLVPARSYLGVRPGVVSQGGHLRFVSEKVWVHLGPVVAGGPSRWPYLLVAAGIGIFVVRRRSQLGGEQLIWLAGAVLALRCAFEAVMTPYYLGPPLIVLLLAGAFRSSKALGWTWALALAVTVYSYARLEPWVWWSPIVLTMALLLVLVRPPDGAPVSGRMRGSEAAVMDDWAPAGGMLAPPAAMTAQAPSSVRAAGPWAGCGPKRGRNQGSCRSTSLTQGERKTLRYLEVHREAIDCSGDVQMPDPANDGRVSPSAWRADAGFTLIELMVVLLILAILLAIAIPTFLGVTKSANDRAAQSNINTAFTNAKALYQQYGQSYANSNVTGWNNASFVSSLAAAEPAVNFTANNSGSTGTVSVWTDSGGGGLVLASYSSSSKNCWLFVDTPGSPSTPSSAPWGGTPTSNGTVGGAGGTNVVFSQNQGEVFAEIKGDGTAADCVASQPKIGNGATYQLGNGGFPS